MLQNKYRLYTIIFIIFLSFSAITVRLSIINFSGEKKKSKKSINPKSILRGNIYDRNGIPLAVNEEVISVYANTKDLSPTELQNKIDKLSSILEIPKQELIEHLNVERNFNWLKRKVNKNKEALIKELNMKGIGYDDEYKRVYPLNNLLSHVLGFTGIDDNGLEGIELAFEKQLKSQSNIKKYKQLLFGYDLYLTIDSKMQQITEKNLKESVEDYQGDGGTVIIMDSKNGEILTLANYPDYNNNFFTRYNNKYFRNIAITDSFEAGSIFKIFTEAILLNENLIDLNQTFHCPGKIVVDSHDNKIVKCAAPHGNVNLRKILKKSCNVGIIKASLSIPEDVFYNYLYRFGFGKKTGIDLKGESSGLLLSYKKLNTFSKSMISFGYGISVTPLQLTTAASAIANKGALQKPLIVKRIINKNGDLKKEFHSKIKEQVIKPETADILKDLMKSVIEEGGTGYKANIPGINTAGKTSTINLWQTGYNEDSVNTAFISFVPTYNSNLTVFYMIRNPKTDKIASNVVVPAFKRLILDFLNAGLIGYNP